MNYWISELFVELFEVEVEVEVDSGGSEAALTGADLTTCFATINSNGTNNLGKTPLPHFHLNPTKHHNEPILRKC